MSRKTKRIVRCNFGSTQNPATCCGRGWRSRGWIAPPVCPDLIYDRHRLQSGVRRVGLIQRDRFPGIRRKDFRETLGYLPFPIIVTAVSALRDIQPDKAVMGERSADPEFVPGVENRRG
jgi:hypothetical protein